MKLALVLFLASAGAFAKTAYVKTSMTKILEHPSSNSNVLNIISQGQKITLKKEQVKNFQKVEFENEIGWVSKYHISSKKLKRRARSLFVKVKSIEDTARDSSSSTGTTASARGLIPSGSNSAVNRKEIIEFDDYEKKFIQSYEELVFLIGRQGI